MYQEEDCPLWLHTSSVIKMYVQLCKCQMLIYEMVLYRAVIYMLPVCLPLFV
jgi:hypothetical protein